MTDKRSLAAASSPMEHALRAARDATGQVEDVERLRQRLDLALASQIAIGPASEALPPKAGWLTGKTWVWIVGAAVGIGGLVLMTLLRPEAARSVVLPPPLVAPRQPGLESPRQPEAEAKSADLGIEPQTGSLDPHTPVIVSRRTPAVSRSLRRTSMPERALQPTAATEQAAASDPAAEVTLITRAQALLLRQPAAALALLIEHENRFAHGVLAQERDTLRIDAERALGQAALAREHARAFIVAFPASPQTRGLSQWLQAQQNVASDHKPASSPVPTP